MSLKEFTRKIFDEYGLSNEEIKIYLAYLATPRATASEVFYKLDEEEDFNLEYDQVVEKTNKLVEKGFLKELSGIVNRYLPLEPYFKLITNQSENFREKIAKTKENALTDQSTRFENLEEIQDKSIQDVKKAVDTQVNAFFEDSDLKNNDKKATIDNAREKFINTNKTLESDIHKIFDTLNTNLKEISNDFVQKNDTKINSTKDDFETIISSLLNDYSTRVNDLETELKRELDSHVDRHGNIANDLKPKMELILEKYLDRMDKIITDLKERISKLLQEHIKHIEDTSSKLKTDLQNTLNKNHQIIDTQTSGFKDRVVQLIDNLLEISDRFSDLAKDLSSRGSAFKSLFFGSHKKYKARYSQVKEDILTYSKPLKKDFISEAEEFIKTDENSTEDAKEKLINILSEENQKLSGKTTELDSKAQQELEAQLDTLANDLAKEIDDTIQGSVNDCSETTIKLKDSLEKSFTQHSSQYDDAIKRHKQESIRHYDDFNTDVNRRNEDWVRDVDTKFINNKRNVTEKTEGEIESWKLDSKELNISLESMLNDHKSKYEQTAKTLQNSISNTIQDNTQNTKDAIADFTLEFMNTIDDVTEYAELNEEKLNDIFEASKNIPEIAEVTTWHTVGREALIAAIRDAVYRTKSSVIIVTPVVVPEVLQVVSEIAFQKKAARFMLTSHFEMDAYSSIIQKMKQLGNIQFRQLSTQGEYYAITRDAEEVIICPYTDNETEMISIVSNQDAYARLYSQFIGPIFQANSRPIK
ncbi:MAG: hypothetical protein P8Y70_00685 [Candidatus Lokiarchaeota archaeon]